MNADHLNIETIVGELQKFQVQKDDDLSQRLAASPSRNRSARSERHVALQLIVEEGFGNRTPLEYLKSITRSI